MEKSQIAAGVADRFIDRFLGRVPVGYKADFAERKMETNLDRTLMLSVFIIFVQVFFSVVNIARPGTGADGGENDIMKYVILLGDVWVNPLIITLLVLFMSYVVYNMYRVNFLNSKRLEVSNERRQMLRRFRRAGSQGRQGPIPCQARGSRPNPFLPRTRRWGLSR